ncbi:hypothetical protein AU106_gp022 [Sinorhizobium phage phiM9]|uniref:Uncharacterized protein n=1 Tax=Sinorhizobium phage phiM9 TaxID=1636182 RepID=A0A0F6R7C1_9CAUD|nr:hypothetical protein AU106_gp022 [Sinorhizobium phage phiM9]AKE44653.1 hypothetical protein Sm_phiM9_023 [Sinorhizobium phage phiM9]
MYVNYMTFMKLGNSRKGTIWTSNEYDDFKPRGSECVWIVPGTVDPRDD